MLAIDLPLSIFVYYSGKPQIVRKIDSSKLQEQVTRTGTAPTVLSVRVCRVRIMVRVRVSGL